MSEQSAIDATALRLERRFEAPVARVFRAWSTPEGLAQWAWGSLGRQVEAGIDFRPGGQYHVSTKRANGEVRTFSGTYLEIVPDKRIVYTLDWHGLTGQTAPEQVAVDLTPADGGTTVVFTHSGVPEPESREGHREGWENTLDALARSLEASP